MIPLLAQVVGEPVATVLRERGDDYYLHVTPTELEQLGVSKPKVKRFNEMQDVILQYVNAPHSIIHRPEIHPFNSVTVANWIRPRIIPFNQEQLWVIGIHRNKAVFAEMVYKGCVGTIVIEMSDIFRRAICAGCPEIFVIHNHPGGSTKPSYEDKVTARTMTRAGLLLGIRVTDFLIVTAGNYSSFRGEGILEKLEEGD